jgi:hypothetical protein
MRLTVELGFSKSYAKIIRVGIYLRILTGIHTRALLERIWRASVGISATSHRAGSSIQRCGR